MNNGGGGGALEIGTAVKVPWTAHPPKLPPVPYHCMATVPTKLVEGTYSENPPSPLDW